MKKRKLIGVILAVMLSLQVLMLTGCGPDANYIEKTSKNLSTYKINAFFSPADKAIVAEQTLLYKNNTENALKELQFHLYPNAFREGAKIAPVDKSDESVAYPNGKSYGRIDITKVTVAAKEAAFEIGGTDENVLIVRFGRELFPDEQVEIGIMFTSVFPNMNHRFSYNNRVFNAGNWYPVACVWEDDGFVADPYYSYGDPFYSEMANYEVNITFPKTYIMAATGDVVGQKVDGDKQMWTISAKCVRDFAFVSSDKFTVLSGKFNDTVVNYYYLDDANSAKNLNISIEALRVFSDLIAAYPYGTLNVVQTDFCFGGMEYPNLVYIATKLSEEDMEKVIVHEIAHQWWYNLVGNDEVKYAWLDEGLTEFTAAYFFKKQPEVYISKFETLVSRAEKSFTIYTDIVKNYHGRVDTVMNRPSHEFNTQQHYVIMTYVKGMLMFNSLKETLGEKRFEKALKLYFEENKTKIARPENLISCFERSFGGSLETYFNSWLGAEGVVMQ